VLSSVPGQTGEAAVFRLRGSLHWRALDDEWVVFDLRSGSLAQLDTLGAAVLSLIEAGPVDEPAMLAALAQASGLAPDAGLQAALRQTLRRLLVDDLVIGPRT
jgi:PqqD family protein of HPr-rel-A system